MKPVLIEADDAVGAAILALPANAHVRVAAGAGDLALYCDADVLHVALQLLLTAALQSAGVAQRLLTIDTDGEYVRFTTCCDTLPAGLKDAAARLGGTVRSDTEVVQLLVPSADWSPSHRH